jgi:flavin reductase (DIM6/NTAB) family NADH-FMN oxidoreductase RutF
MKRIEMPYTERFGEVMSALTSRGLLLGTYDAKGKANAMTIGWGSLGCVWSSPMWIVLVRPSRYTYQCLEHSRCFTVCVPGEELDNACQVCGEKSGRDMDKLAACGLTSSKAAAVNAPDIHQCRIIYECQVVHHNDVVPAHLAGEIQTGMYKNGDYHRLYYGRILATRATPGK